MRTIALFVRPETLFPVRGENAFSAYPRLYRAESFDISLHLSRTSGGRYMLVGLLSSRHAGETIDAFEGMDVDLLEYIIMPLSFIVLLAEAILGGAQYLLLSTIPSRASFG
jgi:hypothetical protein